MEKIALQIFLGAALLCGCTVISMIWVDGLEHKVERLVPTLFIIGFFAFLVWATRIVYRFLDVLGQRK